MQPPSTGPPDAHQSMTSPKTSLLLELPTRWLVNTKGQERENDDGDGQGVERPPPPVRPTHRGRNDSNQQRAEGGRRAHADPHAGGDPAPQA